MNLADDAPTEPGPRGGAPPEDRLADHAALASWWRARGARARPKAIADVLSQLIARRGYAATGGGEALAGAWSRALGAPLAARTRVLGLRGGRLEVLVESSVVAQELQFARERLLAALAQELPEARVSDLRTRVGRLC